ncbi:MAG: flagellar biosynthesis protein [Clostridiales bacterium]|nr:flagellar biosynthesis protein [Clostridiales bacterium]MDN5282649.1 flagellar biosynthesis protein [Candidatus Ozemobacter sp.]
MSGKKKPEIKYDDVAVAIKYAFGQEGEVPQIIASGRGWLANQIIELAEQNDIPLRKNKALADSLARVPVGVEIPAELWGAMAEILVQIYLLDQEKQAR